MNKYLINTYLKVLINLKLSNNVVLQIIKK